ncbi:succinate-semialdehyde dehydrogenase [Snodgrassella alvi]|jgi:succinate-semialdehyde dehydrogenase / glutarate-semialdehyde dehydrogenase|uniref:Succinate-semialdehyde dehydrogenase n=1 Tax=Snodgrassella alvi TaxID=1196083 RepID=A0A066TKD5_9NEIS|nr:MULTISPECIES: NAD-dependent succinate-semialdehyde dehydrogenase [Snodgrassella]KDN12513.1 succinate-semialdehyde dehydrogenase NAD/NADP+ [Snodgrassella communis]PIT09557.1 succinate-semialdehyde dehydrogenase [Snodgrassella communis]PIT47854.1 succinate-semialdehyde dehydrogenase [Snodgrassella alvi]
MAYQTINPFTNEVVKTFSNHTDTEIENTLNQAYALYQSAWAQPENISDRQALLRRLADVMILHQEKIARTITLDMGKLLIESRNEIANCIEIVQFYAEQAAALLKPVAYPSKLGDGWVEHHPIGIILAIEPWNFPIYQLIRVIAPAIAVGNPVVAKHASNVPQCAQLVEDLLREANAPAGTYTNLFVSPDQIAAIISDRRVQGVALTGSESAGSIVAAQAGSKLKKTTMELGGNDVFVVTDDADVIAAAHTAVGGRLYNAGQVCTAAKRYIVHEKVAPQFIQIVQDSFAKVIMGDPLDENTTLAPLSSRKSKENLQKQLDAAITHGAKVLCGNQPAEGNFFTPTLITDISRDNPAYFEEFFGPVAQLYVVKNDDEAIALANDSHFGLGGTVFSKDIERAKKLASRIETGMVFINRFGDSVAELPFGGVKRSGFGRELSDLGIKEFVNHKLVVVGQK